MSSRDTLYPYLAIGISKELNQESRNQAKILHDSESRRRKLRVAGPSDIGHVYLAKQCLVTCSIWQIE